MKPDAINKLIAIGDIELSIPCALCPKKIGIRLRWKHITDDDPTNFMWGSNDTFLCMSKGDKTRVMVHQDCFVKENEQ